MPSPASGLKTRQALIEAAKSFLGQGNSDVSIQEIAEVAEVSVGSVYTYFKDKRELFDAAAKDALRSVTPELEHIMSDWDDSALGFLAASLFASKRPSFAPETSRIILTVGPLGFTDFGDYFDGPKQAIRASVAAGKAKCDDIEAFVMAASGAYQNVLAHTYAGTTSKDMPDRVFLMLTKQLGYTQKDFDRIKKYVENYKLVTDKN